MQEASEHGGGRRPDQQQFAGVDLRRPKGYAPAPQPAASQTAATAAGEADPCPRCESRDTKFCYYNNYNTAQPRHFCKGCRRYWTKGGTLRNVPVGGGTRKKPASSPSSYAAAAKPKRPYKKKRRVAPPEPAAADSYTAPTTTATADDSAKPTTTTELLVPAPAAAVDDALAHLLQPDAVALGLGLSDFPSSGKGCALLEPDSFEWPASFDLGAACWGATTAVGFSDPVDPVLFLNLP